MSVLVTGASGFIGRRLVAALRLRGERVIVLARDTRKAEILLGRAADIEVRYGDLEKTATLTGVCRGADTVFHLGGYAHDVGSHDADAEARYRRVNVGGTERLLEEAISAGVKRFVFASSVKAMGEGGPKRLDEAAAETPASAYGRAKLAGERAVLGSGERGQMCAVVLRFPLVYGPGNKGNLPRMIRAVDRGLFPPLPKLGNRRSLLHVDNAVQALLLAAEGEQACGRTYIVSDDEEYSTHELCELIRSALNKRPSRVAVPLVIWQSAARVGDVIGRLRKRRFVFDSHALDKLTGSAWYSADRIRRELGYVPAKTLSDALPEMVREYRRERTGSE